MGRRRPPRDCRALGGPELERLDAGAAEGAARAAHLKVRQRHDHELRPPADSTCGGKAGLSSPPAGQLRTEERELRPHRSVLQSIVRKNRSPPRGGPKGGTGAPEPGV